MAQSDMSPIQTRAQFEQALLYVAGQADALVEKVCGTHLTLHSLRLFARDSGEYEYMARLLRSYGVKSQKQPRSGMYVDTQIAFGDIKVHKIGLRPYADPPFEAMRGHADFAVEDLDAFRHEYVGHRGEFVRDLPGREGQLVEVWHPDFGALAYIHAA